MQLSTKQEPLIIPDYSLTGDILSYMQCSRQYRYQNGSALPPARPVQLWFGEFVHGVMEMAFTLWKAKQYPFPWNATTIDWKDRQKTTMLPENDIGEIGRKIENTLVVQGKSARNAAARESAYSRVKEAINVIGPHLFPLVAFAEEPLNGSRLLPTNTSGIPLRANRYGLTGIVDVLTEITLAKASHDNHIRNAIEREFAANGIMPPDEYEVIVDYKGAARPDKMDSDPAWEQHDWQIQTYAWLRGRKIGAKPVLAGILFYVNELLPNEQNMRDMANLFHKQKLEFAPEPGSSDFNTLNLWKNGVSGPLNLSIEFRLQRALRVVPVTQTSIDAALEQFDRKVLEIETNISTEVSGGNIVPVWVGNCKKESTCVACDFRWTCTSQAGRRNNDEIAPPMAP